MEKLEQQANAWLAVVEVLEEIKPGFMNEVGSGAECAVRAIRELAAVPQGVQPELVAALPWPRAEVEDLLERLVTSHVSAFIAGERGSNNQEVREFVKSALVQAAGFIRAVMHPINPDIQTLHPTQQGLEQDAKRYQWLRDQHNKGDDSVTIFIGDEQHGPGHLDAQIDEAVAAQAKQGEQANG